ncbi:MAG TPA: SBBP repeat-containing protein, partial [Pyrinomonadaceae bacterium]|nr:SBBP repeat-containing protein [Pyrinomonadaceae bacterium]
MKYLSPRTLRVLCLLLLLCAAFGVTRQSAETKTATHVASDGARQHASARDDSYARDLAARASARRSYGQLPLSFEANRGQTDARVKFLARNQRYGLFLTADEAVLALRGNGAADAHNTKAGESAVLRMRVEGANRRARAEGLEELPGRSNYLVGADPRRWQAGVPNYGRVRFEGVYEGVDLVYYGNQRQLEYDFNVAAGADPSAIRLSFKGAQSVKLDERGDLRIETPAGELRQHKPVAYQTIDGGRREVACSYLLARDGRVTFKLGAYDRGRALVIDPILSYATYLGGSNVDEARAVAVDHQGNAYVVGTTVSTNFPVTPGAFQTSLGGTVTFTYDAFITKLNPDGTQIIYSTFLGGNGGDGATAVAVNPYGQVYLAGETSSTNFPVYGAFQPKRRGGQDAFVTQLDANGSALLYSTYLGGTENEYGPALALTPGGDVAVAGRTFSPDFPVLQRAFQRYFGGGTCPAGPCADGFVTQLKMWPTSPVSSTFLGGTGDD